MYIGEKIVRKSISFFGHRRISKKIELRERLMVVIEEKIKDAFNFFMVGTHGDFDILVLSVLRELRHKYPSIEIQVVFTTLILFKKNDRSDSIADYYKDVKTIVYDFENEHFKKQIIYTNRKIVDYSDLIICYVDMKEYVSGSKRAINYAQKQEKEIINLFKESDRPFYGMTEEEKQKYWKIIFKKKLY